MIGDAVAAGKRGNSYKAGPEFKKKNSEGRSHKHVDGPRLSHGGGDTENKKSAKSARSSAGPKFNTSDKQAPHKQRASKELKHVDQGQILNEWCAGKRGSYK
jgi:hypothetical protein